MAQRKSDAITSRFGGPWRVFGTVAAMLVLVLATLGVLVWLGNDKSRFPDLRASIALPLLLLVGLGSLLLLIALLVAVLDGFDLTDKRHAFGLPDGSMQAVIALSLILIFIISSLYLYSSLPDTITTATEEAAQNKRELAQQLLTTVGTLAVAVAGFYFGTRSVEAAAAITRRASEAAAVRLIWPSSPTALALRPGTTLEPIIVETDPDDRRIKTDVTGDSPTTLAEVAPGTFRYERGPAAAGRVVLAFSLMDGSEKVELEVLEPKPTPKSTPTPTPTPKPAPKRERERERQPPA